MRRIEAKRFYRDKHDDRASGIYNSPFWHGDGTPADCVRLVLDRDYRKLLRAAKALESSVQARDHFLRIQFSGAKSDVRSAHDAVLRAHADEERAIDALNKRSTKP